MIGELLQTLVAFVPPWLLATGVALVALALAPGWIEGLRVKRVKALLRRTVRADDAARTVLIDEALALASGRAEVLAALVREADKLNQPGLRDRALASLASLGTHPDLVRQLRAPADPTQDRRFGHPVEAAVSIERLLEVGAVAAAEERLREALRRFPKDEGLLALRDRLAHRAAGDSTG